MNSNTTTESSSFPSRGRSCQKERRVGFGAGWEDIWTSVPRAADQGHAVFRRSTGASPRLRVMKRLVGVVLGICLVVVVVLIPALLWGESLEDEPVDEPTTITSYVAVFDVDDDGDMAVTETLTVDFPISGRHGIFRFFDKADPSAPKARRIPHDIQVTMDGGDVPVEIISNDQGGRYVTVKIGDPDSTVSTGEHVYEISYQIDGVLEKGTTGSDAQFY